MALKKSELYSRLWRSCDALRGGMDASQYKDYVLSLLFVKYVSDKYGNDPDGALIVPPGGSFADMVALKGTKEIGDRLNKVLGELAKANDLQGVIDAADFNDAEKLGKDRAMVDRLTNLVSLFEDLDFSRNQAGGDDLLGDAYEFLMRHFATESGKSKGQFYTPAEVSQVMARVIGLGAATATSQTIYDPTCGSGSLLLKAHDEAQTRTGHNLAIYGQEMDNATVALAKMNMILHSCPTAEIWQDNTLSHPHWATGPDLKRHDFALANPPFSTKAWASGIDPLRDTWGRFAFGVPPAKNGDYAFLLHILASLKSTGKGAVILPHGVLFRGNAEGGIRANIVRNGYIKGIIGLPANLFYGTGIPACIIVLDKAGAQARDGIFMVDASRGFKKDGNKNRLRARDIHKIVDVFTREAEVPGYSRRVPLDEIVRNGFNLNLPRYIDASDPEDIHDIGAHLHGGIPARDVDALAPFWDVFPEVREAVFVESRPGYLEARVPVGEVRAAIFSHPQFRTFHYEIMAIFDAWKLATAPKLLALQKGDAPKPFVESVSESLLTAFLSARLVDAYSVYQHFMDYAAETLQDDVYQIAQAGWRGVIDGAANTELIPAPLVIARYFAGEQAEIEQYAAVRDAVVRALEELDEEYGGEDGLLSEAKPDVNKKPTKQTLTARLKVIGHDKVYADERTILLGYAERLTELATASKAVAEAQKCLDDAVGAKYAALTEDEARELVVRDKWLPAIEAGATQELDRVSQTLTGRVKQLAERYATALPELTANVAALSARVDAHLSRMGVQ